MLVGVDLVLTLESGGAEDGTPTWATPVDISCATREYRSPNRAITVDTTTRCATLVTNKGIRAQRDVSISIDVPDSGVALFGTAVNTYWRVSVKFITSATAEVLICVLRENEISSPAEGRDVQTVRLEVQSVS